VADIHDIRKRNFKALVTQWNGPTNLAKELGYNGPSYVSQMVSGNRPITEKTARQIEGKLNLTTGVLDRDNSLSAKGTRPAAVDTQMISRIISLVTTTLQESGMRLQPDKFAELVAMVYEDAQERGHADEKLINRVIGLLK
jgi:plasmid maintenance system antidote protein VapI